MEVHRYVFEILCECGVYVCVCVMHVLLHAVLAVCLCVNVVGDRF